MRREHRFLLSEIVDAHGEDGPCGRGLVSEPSDVGLAERPLPRERLAGDVPRADSVVTLGLRDLGETERDASDVVESHALCSLRSATDFPMRRGDACCAVLGAQRNHEPPAHHRHRAAVGVTANGHDAGWPSAAAEALDDLVRHGEAGGRLAPQLDGRREAHHRECRTMTSRDLCGNVRPRRRSHLKRPNGLATDLGRDRSNFVTPAAPRRRRTGDASRGAGRRRGA